MKMGYGEFIRKHRIASGYKKQKDLADKTGISAATISRIENEIQKPEIETLKTLTQHLATTSLVELMVVCGYANEDDLLEGIDDNPKMIQLKKTDGHSFIQEVGRASGTTKETPTNEEEFVKSIDLTDDEILDQFDLKIDGRSLTEDEAKWIIDSIRSIRRMKLE